MPTWLKTKAVRKTAVGILIKSKLSPKLKSMVNAGDAHWVTVKSGALEGRHLLISGPRPASGKKSTGKILAGHGIPTHVIEKITGATRASDLEHEQSHGPKLPSLPEEFEEEVMGRRVVNGHLINPKTGEHIDVDRIEEASAEHARKVRANGIKDPVYAFPRLGRNAAITERAVAEKAMEQAKKIRENVKANMERNVPGLEELANANNKYERANKKYKRAIDNDEIIRRPPSLDEVKDLQQKYPRAQMYLVAQAYSHASNDVKASAGYKAMDDIRRGEPLEKVREDLNSWHVPKSRPKPSGNTKTPHDHELRQLESQIRHNKTESGHVFTKEGHLVWSQPGGKDYVDVSDAVDRGHMKGNIFTHNHPGGSSFSPEDIDVMLSHGLAEMRAVSKKHTHSMKPPKDFDGDPDTVRSVLEEYNKAAREVRNELQSKVNNGTMTPTEAGERHFHEIWTRVAKRTGLQYERTDKDGFKKGRQKIHTPIIRETRALRFGQGSQGPGLQKGRQEREVIMAGNGAREGAVFVSANDGRLLVRRDA